MVSRNFCQKLVRVIFPNFHTVLTEKALSKCSSKQSVIHKSHDGIGNSQSQFLDFLAKKVIWYKYGTAKEVEMGSRMFFKVTTKFLISFLRFFFILCSIFFKSELINCSIQLFRHIKFEYRAVNQIKTQKCNSQGSCWVFSKITLFTLLCFLVNVHRIFCVVQFHEIFFYLLSMAYIILKVKFTLSSVQLTSLGKQCSQSSWVAPSMTNKEPGNNGNLMKFGGPFFFLKK